MSFHPDYRYVLRPWSIAFPVPGDMRYTYAREIEIPMLQVRRLKIVESRTGEGLSEDDYEWCDVEIEGLPENAEESQKSNKPDWRIKCAELTEKLLNSLPVTPEGSQVMQIQNEIYQQFIKEENK